MAVQHLEVSTENLLSAVVRMPEDEFDKFVEKAKKLRNGSRKTKWTKDEIAIIGKLNKLVFSDEKQNRFIELIKKRQNATISESEFEELLKLTEESEELDVKRIELLVKLAKSKNKSLDKIMEMLEIRPPEIL